MKKTGFSQRSLKYRRKKRKMLHIGIALFIGGIVMWGLLFTSISQRISSEMSEKKILSDEVMEVPRYPPIKIKKYVTINIINSTGNNEQGKKIVTALVKSGYSLTNIEISKTAAVEDMGTTITSNTDYEAIVTHIKDVLKSITPEISDGSPNNDPNVDSGFDVVILTGNRMNNTIVPKSAASLP